MTYPTIIGYVTDDEKINIFDSAGVENSESTTVETSDASYSNNFTVTLKTGCRITSTKINDSTVVTPTVNDDGTKAEYVYTLSANVPSIKSFEFITTDTESNIVAYNLTVEFIAEEPPSVGDWSTLSMRATGIDNTEVEFDDYDDVYDTWIGSVNVANLPITFELATYNHDIKIYDDEYTENKISVNGTVVTATKTHTGSGDSDPTLYQFSYTPSTNVTRIVIEFYTGLDKELIHGNNILFIPDTFLARPIQMYMMEGGDDGDYDEVVSTGFGNRITIDDEFDKYQGPNTKFTLICNNKWDDVEEKALTHTDIISATLNGSSITFKKDTVSYKVVNKWAKVIEQVYEQNLTLVLNIRQSLVSDPSVYQDETYTVELTYAGA